ncbi:hypothetical protein MP638_002130 [Amoeboaphelidium occidentale]|nr:hypothetical protein MP638_002130 [Amoeboaphelidium occidentale]
MLLLLQLLLVFLVLVQYTLAQQQQCSSTRIRYNWFDLPAEYQQRYIRAMNTLHRESDRYNAITRRHVQNVNQWHGLSVFLPAHRAMLLELEQALRTIDPGLVIPYWDWSIDASAPHQSRIWETYGRSQPYQCVTQGAFANWQVPQPNPHCVSRGIDFQSGTGAWWSSEVLGLLVRNTPDFGQFASTLENSPHNLVHLAIGGGGSGGQAPGDMAYRDMSPNDPLFYMHHGFVDKLWFDWQSYHNPQGANRFSGNTNTQIPGYSYTVENILNTRDLCYVYAPPGTAFSGPEVPNGGVPTSSSIPAPIPTSTTFIAPMTTTAVVSTPGVQTPTISVIVIPTASVTLPPVQISSTVPPSPPDISVTIPVSVPISTINIPSTPPPEIIPISTVAPIVPTETLATLHPPEHPPTDQKCNDTIPCVGKYCGKKAIPYLDQCKDQKIICVNQYLVELLNALK